MLSRDNNSPTQLEADGDSRTPSDKIDSADIKQSLQVVFETDERALQELDQEKEQQQLEEMPQPQPGDRGAPRDSDGPPEQQQQTIENPSPRLSLPLLDVLSIDSSGGAGGGSPRSSLEADATPERCLTPNPIALADAISIEVEAAALADQALACKRNSAGALGGGMDGRRGSMEFDSESFLSLGGGGRTSFMDLSEAAQVLLIRVACVVVSA